MTSIFKRALSFSAVLSLLINIALPTTTQALPSLFKTKAKPVALKKLPAPYVKPMHPGKLAGPFPCDGGFELDVTIQAVNVAEPTPVGLHVEIPTKGRGIASRTHADDRSEFSNRQCEIWQKTFWPKLKPILFSNNEPERRNVACTNVATLEYKLAGKFETAKICLNSPLKDALSSNFNYFYEGTDSLLAR